MSALKDILYDSINLGILIFSNKHCYALIFMQFYLHSLSSFFWYTQVIQIMLWQPEMDVGIWIQGIKTATLWIWINGALNKYAGD